MTSYLHVDASDSEPSPLHLQVDPDHSEPRPLHSEGVRKRWTVAAVACTVLLSSMALLSYRSPDPMASMSPAPVPKVGALEVAKDLGVTNFLELFLEDEVGQSTSSNSTRTSAVQQVIRQLQDITGNPQALPIASCTVDSYLVASFIGILGNIINGAVKSCKRADKTRKVFKRDVFIDLLPNLGPLLGPREKIVLLDLLDQGCRIGIESTISIVAFIVGFLARAVNDCAMAMQPPTQNLGASCAGDMGLLTAGIAFLTGGAETAQALCPPHPMGLKLDIDLDVEALDIVDGIARRLAPKIRPLDIQKDDVKDAIIKRLPALGPLASTFLDNREFFKLRRKKRKDQGRTDKLIKCGFDVAGLVGFTAAVGVFITAATMECPVAVGDSAQAEGLKMGCSLDISAVIAALTSIAGFIGILATECPEDPETPAKNLCVTAGFNLVSSLGFISGSLSDAARSCPAI